MSTMTKFITVLTLTGGLAALSAVSAHAFSMITPSQEDQSQTATYVHPPIAFAGGTSGTNAQNGFALSPHEIKHIQWCAQRYQMNYNATDNTYISSDGKSATCRSPQ